jgi:acylphosphatase
VRNTPNNKVRLSFGRSFIFLISIQVEGEAQGEEDVLQNFLKDIDQGPRHAHVVKLEKSEIEVQEGETAFEVKH